MQNHNKFDRKWNYELKCILFASCLYVVNCHLCTASTCSYMFLNAILIKTKLSTKYKHKLLQLKFEDYDHQDENILLPNCLYLCMFYLKYVLLLQKWIESKINSGCIY